MSPCDRTFEVDLDLPENLPNATEITLPPAGYVTRWNADEVFPGVKTKVAHPGQIVSISKPKAAYRGQTVTSGNPYTDGRFGYIRRTSHIWDVYLELTVSVLATNACGERKWTQITYPVQTIANKVFLFYININNPEDWLEIDTDVILIEDNPSEDLDIPIIQDELIYPEPPPEELEPSPIAIPDATSPWQERTRLVIYLEDDPDCSRYSYSSAMNDLEALVNSGCVTNINTETVGKQVITAAANTSICQHYYSIGSPITFVQVKITYLQRVDCN